MAADSSLTLAVAAYVRALARAETTRAEDRPALQLLTANAAALLAEAVLGDHLSVAVRLEAHERIRGHTWLQGVALAELNQLWSEVRSQGPRPAI